VYRKYVSKIAYCTIRTLQLCLILWLTRQQITLLSYQLPLHSSKSIKATF